jgi:hypothetical protein
MSTTAALDRHRCLSRVSDLLLESETGSEAGGGAELLVDVPGEGHMSVRRGLACSSLVQG